MTENISMGDYIALQDTHGKSRTGNALATVVGVGLAILVLALIWNAYAANRERFTGSEKNTSVKLGELEGKQEAVNGQLATLIHNERQDALRIAYTDGALRPYPFAAHGGGWGYPQYGEGHGEHRNGHCCTKSSFKEVKTFTPTTNDVTLTTVCGG